MFISSVIDSIKILVEKLLKTPRGITGETLGEICGWIPGRTPVYVARGTTGRTPTGIPQGIPKFISVETTSGTPE